MYKIDWDTENNLLILKNENAFLNNEYRPVFPEELKNFGFDKYFSFDESGTAPVLWAFRYRYFYRGRLIAELAMSRSAIIWTTPSWAVILSRSIWISGSGRTGC